MGAHTDPRSSKSASTRVGPSADRQIVVNLGTKGSRRRPQPPLRVNRHLGSDATRNTRKQHQDMAGTPMPMFRTWHQGWCPMYPDKEEMGTDGFYRIEGLRKVEPGEYRDELRKDALLAVRDMARRKVEPQAEVRGIPQAIGTGACSKILLNTWQGPKADAVPARGMMGFKPGDQRSESVSVAGAGAGVVHRALHQLGGPRQGPRQYQPCCGTAEHATSRSPGMLRCLGASRRCVRRNSSSFTEDGAHGRQPHRRSSARMPTFADVLQKLRAERGVGVEISGDHFEEEEGFGGPSRSCCPVGDLEDQLSRKSRWRRAHMSERPAMLASLHSGTKVLQVFGMPNFSLNRPDSGRHPATPHFRAGCI